MDYPSCLDKLSRAINNVDGRSLGVDSTVSVWLGALPDGDSIAQTRLLDRYRDEVVRYADWRLRRLGVRAKDGEDIAQEVFAGLFRRIESGQMRDLNNRDQLWMRLRRLVGDRVKEALRKKLPDTESVLGSPSDSAPSPISRLEESELEHCYLLVEHALVRRRLEDKNEDLPKIAAMKMQGYTVQEIADEFDTAKRNVERRLEWINQICDEYAREE